MCLVYQNVLCLQGSHDGLLLADLLAFQVIAGLS